MKKCINLDSSGTSGRGAGYKGTFTDKGEIQGTIPVYISVDNGINWYKVTSLVHTFYNCSNLKIAPKIPEFVNDMSVTFYKCDNLTTASEIPSSVIRLSYTFANCVNIVGSIKINAEADKFNDCFLNCSTNDGSHLTISGTSSILNELLKTKSSNSNIEIVG